LARKEGRKKIVEFDFRLFFILLQINKQNLIPVFGDEEREA
jgi:hypothetical protein